MPTSHAHIIGRRHRLLHQNCHDFALSGSPAPGYSFGIVLDGCGSKHRLPDGRAVPSHNEVGAKLLGHFAGGWLAANLPGSAALPELLVSLQHACLNYLQTILAATTFNLQHTTFNLQPATFLPAHLLTTLLGFAVTPAEAAFFWAGDGYLCADGRVTALDSGNRPDYLAYALLPHPRDIALQIQPLENPSWLAVATDGWQPAALAALAEPRPPLALQRWLNAQARERGKFEDDGAAAVWWKEPVDGEL